MQRQFRKRQGARQTGHDGSLRWRAINRDAAGSNAFRHAWALSPIVFALLGPFRAELGLGPQVSGDKKAHSAGARHPNSVVAFVKEIGHDYCKQCVARSVEQ